MKNKIYKSNNKNISIKKPNWIFVNTFILIDYQEKISYKYNREIVLFKPKQTNFILIGYKKIIINSFELPLDKIYLILNRFQHLNKYMPYIKTYVKLNYKNINLIYKETCLYLKFSLSKLCKILLLLFDDIIFYKKTNLFDFILNTFYKNSNSVAHYKKKSNFLEKVIYEFLIIYIYNIILYVTNKILASPYLKKNCLALYIKKINYLSPYFVKYIEGTQIIYTMTINEFYLLINVDPVILEQINKANLGKYIYYRIIYALPVQILHHLKLLFNDISLNIIKIKKFILGKVLIMLKYFSSKKKTYRYYIVYNSEIKARNFIFNAMMVELHNLEDWGYLENIESIHIKFQMSLKNKDIDLHEIFKGSIIPIKEKIITDLKTIEEYDDDFPY